MDVREAIRDEFVGLGDDFELDLTTEPGWVTCSLNRADRIMALIAEALLSEQAVETTAVTLAALDGLNWCFDGETSNPYFRQDVLKKYRERARAALAAAGVTGAGQEGGVGGMTTDELQLRHNAMCDVSDERERQNEKWGGVQDLTSYQYLAVATEELGEVAQAALHDEFGGSHAGTLRAELVQLAAVVVQWIERIDMDTTRAASCHSTAMKESERERVERSDIRGSLRRAQR